jgi:hypothetical protein
MFLSLIEPILGMHDERVDEAIADLLKTVDSSVPDSYRQQLTSLLQK